MRSFTATAGWIVDTPPRLLHRLYERCGKPPLTPSKTTIWQVITHADASALDAAVGTWLAARADIDITPDPQPRQCCPAADTERQPEQGAPRAVLAVDGKRVRNATDTDGNAPHLLAARHPRPRTGPRADRCAPQDE